MQSIGTGAEKDVAPIKLAFASCGRFLARFYGQMEVIFTRCPFPADSYDWDAQLSGIIDENQLYFIKSGNSVLFPTSNGFRQWVGGFLKVGRKTLVVTGCTLNSCVRVSSMEAQKEFCQEHLQLVVDMSMCGARARNYVKSPSFGGLSAVEFAVEQMLKAGVRVVSRIDWNDGSDPGAAKF